MKLHNKNDFSHMPSSKMLTHNDMLHYYAITKVLEFDPVCDDNPNVIYFFQQCCWNPNFVAYSWLFTATKSGLCRINNYKMANIISH